MIKFSPCIEMIFSDSPFSERMERVKSAGFQAFEFWDWRNKEIGWIKKEIKKLGLDCAAILANLINPLVRPVMDKGKLSEEVKASIEVAHDLGCQTLIMTTGNAVADMAREVQHKNIVDNLSAIASLAEEEKVTIVLEPLNALVDHKGYYLSSSLEGFEIIKEVKCPNIKLLYDVYHQQIMEGNLIQNITSNIDLIGHFHIADVPGRHEPGTGEINYTNVLKCINDLGYEGYIGLEFKPSMQPHEKALELILDMTNRFSFTKKA